MGKVYTEHDDDNNGFVAFPKIARLKGQGCVITEKIDGTNAQVHITDSGQVLAASRNRYVTLDNDNYGFAFWVSEHKDQLLKLGPGRHYGEWWGLGIQRGYGLNEKRFSLFNSGRWSNSEDKPECCGVVPVLFAGEYTTANVDATMHKLKETGSVAAPGFMNPEGVIVWHSRTRDFYKSTFDYKGGKWAGKNEAK